MVDDLEINNRIITEQLSRINMQVDSCVSGKEALLLAKKAVAAGAPYHMMMIDYLMPTMNGEELAREVKADPLLRDTALIMLTATGGRGFIERFDKAGFSSILSKPIRQQPLIETVATVWEAYQNGHSTGLIVNDSFARKKNKRAEDVRFVGASVLLAEDNRVNQEFAHEILTSMGCQVENRRHWP